ncbi:MAG TPA: CHAD domain-containing protein [Gallionellaceae bacterium]|nr:CHAD domain-containing protein [Gallionellaceae bacterium]
MAIETELKLRIAPEQLARLKRHPLLKAHQLTPPTTRRLYNIYYDTPKLELQQSGMALRLRRSGKKWLQTLKGGGGVQGGLHRRNEWEMPVRGPALDFSLPQVAEWDELLPKKLRKKLQPVFVTDFSRNSRMLSWQDAQIELCMDHGEVSTEHLRTPICELELELKSGEPQQLFELALSILDIVPFALESISKAEQGFRLMGGVAEQPVKALPVKLDKHDELGKAMQTLIWSVLQQVQGNVRGLELNQKIPVALEPAEGLVQQLTVDNVEYLHQLRVALCRLSVLLQMAESVCADEQLAAFRQDIAALCIILGRVRDWDVFIANTVQPMCARMPQDAGLVALLAASRKQRDGCCGALRNDAQARELQRLLLRFAIWMHGEYWQKFAETGLQARDFAAAYLSELSGQFEQAAAHLEPFDAAKLHVLRIQAKKLKYCAEFFASLYGKHKLEQYLAALSAVQEVLGQINDDAVANRLLDGLAATQALSGHEDALALVRGRMTHDLPQQMRVLQDAMHDFKRQLQHWKN